MSLLKSDFRKFAQAGELVGGRDLDPKSGYHVVFDAWSQTYNFVWRVWSINPDLKVEVRGEGFEVVGRDRASMKQSDWDDDEDKPEGEWEDYCHIIKWELRADAGYSEVFLPGIDPLRVSWSNGVMLDLEGNEARIVRRVDHVRIVEILTAEERKSYALEDRIDKLMKMVRRENEELFHTLLVSRQDILESTLYDEVLR